MATLTNLYPPIVDTYMPAFIVDSDDSSKNICRVYFSLSLFNNVSEIKNVQVAVRNQLTNTSALNSNRYPSEVMLQSLKTDTTRTTDDKYYIEILPSDMDGENFDYDTYYKVQLRFTSVAAPEVSTAMPQAIDAWLADNINFFSEWSTVCLVRGISQPKIALQTFGEGPVEIYSTIANVQVLGRLTFDKEDENETLSTYRIRLYDDLTSTLLLDSGNIYTNQFVDINSISYTLNYDFEAGQTYYFTIDYTTNNLYSEQNEYSFSVIQAETEPLNIQLTAWTDDENGCVGMKVNRSRAQGFYTGSIIIRRASDKDNFTTWHDMYVQTFDAAPYIEYTWNDYTIESGVFYWYAIQGVGTDGARTPMTKFNQPIMVTFDNTFLLSNDKQLKVKFNPSITSFKHTLSETKTDTIGSKYPIIRRNGYVDYIQFPIGGMISSEMDEEGLFTTKEEAFGTSYDYYLEYNDNNDITTATDIIYEKKFRDKVIDFLYADTVKLFRSPTEGNLLIRIMDVNFQPNQTLGRRLWSFTGTAYQIDDDILDNYYKYNIFTTKGDTIVGSGNGEDASALTPIRKVVFLDSEDDFPIVGSVNVLYICEGQLYLWDLEESKYIIISVPRWNEQPNLLGAIGTPYDNTLYSDGESLFTWNSGDNEFEKISEIPVKEG